VSIDIPTGRVLPPGFTEAQFQAAITAFAATIGEEFVAVGDGADEFRDPYDYPEWDDHAPSAVLRPGSVEDVQAIVRIAGEHGVPLWTTSRGLNNGYGGSAPRVAGSVIVRLDRMNRILEVDETLGYVVVEPGVSFFDLVEELQRRGGNWWPSTPDLGWGSVVGNSVDHGWGYTEFGDHAAAVAGMEVVLPDGSLLRTGMWASSKSKAAHAHRRGFGPDVAPLFMQSGMGIVTKLGRFISPRPEVFVPINVRAHRESDLAGLIDATRTLMLEGTIRNVPVVGGVLGAAAMRQPRAGWLPDDERIDESKYREIMEAFGIGWWNLRAALYGPAAVVSAQLARVREVYEAAVPGCEVHAREIPGTEVNDETVTLHGDRVQAGRPSLKLLDVVKWWGPDGGHIELAPIAPMRGEDSVRLNEIMREEAEAHGFDFWPSIAMTPRSQVYLGVIVFDRSKPERVQAAYDAYARLIRRFGEEGYTLYRGHVRGMDLIQAEYDWNDHAMRRFVERIKDTVDPDGILSPGKQGIWPARYRD